MKPSFSLRHFALVCAVLLAAGLIVPGLFSLQAKAEETNSLQAVWQRAQTSGAYHFAADVVQKTIPMATTANLGRSSREQTFHLIGDADLEAQRLELTMQAGAGGTASAATTIKIEHDQTYTRQGDGEWQQTSNFTGAFAPQGNLLAYLAATKDVVNLGSETRTGIAFTRYTFSIDGLAFAHYMRDQMTAQLASTGKLPPGVKLDLPAQYREMTGSGELWIDENGLPLRQIISIQFPPQGDYRVAADFTVDFSGFAAPQPSPWQMVYDGGLNQLGKAIAAINIEKLTLPLFELLKQIGLLLLLGSLLMLMLYYRRTRPVNITVTFLIIASTVIGPLLQTQSAVAFSDRMLADVEAQQQANLESQRSADLLTATAGPEFNPQRNPLEAVSAVAVNAPMAQAQLPAINPCTDPTDSDGDGLTDCQEKLLGTSPTKVDSDGDDLTDLQEVTGFTFGGQPWYSDPTEASTLKDNVLDGLRCPVWPNCPDSDRDGTPDLFDYDIDGDGVRNLIDFSPFTSRGNPTLPTPSNEIPFSGDKPMQLAINGLTENLPTVVEFQVRPTVSAHLYQGYNVLNWPSGDLQGQIQRDSGSSQTVKTFFDECIRAASGDCQMSPNANGDIKLVPMLEIIAQGNLPSAGELAQFGGITLQKQSNFYNSPKIAYVPLQVVNDPTTNDRVAFQGRMLYRPGATWGDAHQVRLVWVVQMLVDVCQRSEGNNCASYIDANGRDMHGQVQVVHSYNDDWELTALKVREDSGVDYAIIYEDPTVDTAPDVDNALFGLAHGLDSAFLAGRDCDQSVDGNCQGDGVPDLTINGRGQSTPTIAQRFDRTQNGSVSDAQRWNIPNTLRVVNRSFGFRDEAIAKMAMGETQSILNSAFGNNSAITPTLMLAREEHFRTLNLSLQTIEDKEYITWSTDPQMGQQLTINFDANEGTAVQTFAGLNFAPYHFDTLAQRWQSVPLTDYLADMDRRYGTVAPGEDATVEAGKFVILQLFYATLHNGLENLVQYGNQPIVDNSVSDELLKSDLLKVDDAFGGGARFVVNKFVFRGLFGIGGSVGALETQKFLGALKGTSLRQLAGSGFVDDLSTLIYGDKTAFNPGLLDADGNALNAASRKKGAGIAAGITVALATVGTTIALAQTGLIPEKAQTAVIATFGGGLSGYSAFTQSKQLYRYYGQLQATTEGLAMSRKLAAVTVLSSGSEVIEMTKSGGAAGLLVDVAITWSIFGIMVSNSGLKAGTAAYNVLVATALADTVIAILSFVVALTSVGAIVLALVGFIDLLLLGLCQVDKTFCFGLTSTVSQAIAKALYSNGTTLNFAHKDGDGNSDLINMGPPSMRLGAPQNGMTHGNTVRYSTKIDTTIYHNRPANGGATYWPSLYTQSRLKDTVFSYSLSSPDKEKLPKPAAGTMANQWRDAYIFDQVRYGHWALDHTVYEDFNFWTANASQSVSTDPITLTKGLNQQIPLWFNASYSAPGYTCLTYDCDPTNDKGEIPSSLVGTMVLDVLPVTFNEFLAMNWDRPGNLFFLQPRLDRTRQFDFDGDGLAYNVDPDDTKADIDGDGLSDYSELTDFKTKPGVSDSDGDGLSDYQEVLIGSNPNVADSDGDGFSDLSEVEGHSLTYGNGLVTKITTDPTRADSDGDGLLDPTEFNLGFNPRVYNENTIAIYQSVNDGDRYVHYGDNLTFTATVQNKFPRSISPGLQGITPNGTLVTTFAPGLTGATSTSYLTLPPGQELNTSINFSVGPGSGSRIALINSTASGTLGDFQQSNYGAFNMTRSLSLHIDDDNPSAVLLTNIVAAGATTIIGGSASDPTSYVTKVEVNINNGGLRTATGGDINASGGWAIDWDVPDASGIYPVQVQTTDAVGNVGSQSFTISVDGDAPTVTATAPTVRFAARKDDKHRWVVGINGTTTDPGPVASGLDNVEIRLEPNGGGWQRAMLAQTGNASAWSLAYVLPDMDDNNEARPDPTGTYTYTVRAQDQVGNGTALADYARGTLRIDNRAPSVSLNPLPSNVPPGLLPVTDVITQTVTLSGVVSETGSVQTGIQSVEIAFVPASVTDLYSTTQLLLPLGDPTGSQTLLDYSGNNYATVHLCGNTPCAANFVAGKEGSAVQLDGSQRIEASNVTVPATNFTLSGWFNTNCPGCGILSIASGTTTDRQLLLSGGNVCSEILNGNSEQICSATGNFADGQWHLAAQSVSSAGHQLYVDGQLAASGIKTSTANGATGTVVVGRAPAAATPNLTGRVDQITLFAAPLRALPAAALYRSWQPVSLSNAGLDVFNAIWSAPVPTDLEGFFQIDLTATDVLGNYNDDRLNWNHWRGEIDLIAPRLGINVQYRGVGGYASTIFTGYAEDLNLTEDNLQFPCTPTFTRTYNTLTRPGEPQRLNRIDLTCTVPGHQVSNLRIRACDSNDLCASQQAPDYRLYAATTEQGIIRANPNDGSQIEVLVSQGNASATGSIELDKSRAKMYWAAGSTLKRANLDGSGVETLQTGLTGIRRLALNSAAGKIYWSQPNRIVRANLDGSGQETLLTPQGAAQIIAIDIDLSHNIIYWAEQQTAGCPNALCPAGKIWQSDLNAPLGHSIQNQFNGAALDPGWANYDVNWFTTVYQGGGITDLTFGKDIYGFDKVYWSTLAADPASSCGVGPNNLCPSLDGIGQSSPDGGTTWTAISPVKWNVDGIFLDPRGVLYANEGRGSQTLYRFIPTDVRSLYDTTQGKWLSKNLRDEPIFAGLNVTGMAFELIAYPSLATPDLKITKAASKQQVVSVPANSNGDQITYTLTIENVGSLPASNVVVTDTLPNNVTFRTATTSRGQTCPAPSGQAFSCLVGTVAVGEKLVVTIDLGVGPTLKGFIENTAGVHSAETDSNQLNNYTFVNVSNVTATPSPTLTPTPINTPILTPTPVGLDKELYYTNGLNTIFAISPATASSRLIASLADNTIDSLVYSPLPFNNIYWAERKSGGRILRANLDGSGVEVVIDALEFPRYLTLGTINGNRLLFYFTQERIYAPGGGSYTSVDRLWYTFVGGGTPVPILDSVAGQGIAVDELYKTIYYAEFPNRIMRVDFSGSQPGGIQPVLALNTAGLPDGLTFDDGKLYWFENNQVKRSAVAGHITGPAEVIATIPAGSGNSLTVDTAANRIYWINPALQKIQYAALAVNSPVQDLASIVGTSSRGLALVYVIPPTPTPTDTATPTNTNTPTLSPTPTNTPTPSPTACAETTGTLRGKVFSDLNQNGVDDNEPGIAGVTVSFLSSTIETTTDSNGLYQFNNLGFGLYTVFVPAPVGATGGNILLQVTVGPCGNPVQNFGFYIPSTPTPTITPTRVAATATPSGTVAKSLFWSSGDQIQAVQLDGLNQRTVYQRSGVFVFDMAYNAATNQLYWLEGNSNPAPSVRIMQANLDGSNAQFLGVVLDGATDLAVDPIGNRLYWRESIDGNPLSSIISADLNDVSLQSSWIQVIVNAGDGLAVDGQQGKLYWGEDGSPGKIVRANLDGSGRTDFITGLTQGDLVRDIVLDGPTNEMYYVQDTNQIKRDSLVLPQNTEIIATGSAASNGLVVDQLGSRIYWLERGTGIYWAQLTPGASRQSFLADATASNGMVLAYAPLPPTPTPTDTPIPTNTPTPTATPTATNTPIPSLTVNTNNDVLDGVCDVTHCSLREAIDEANNVAGLISIHFAPGVTGAIVLTAGQLDINDDLIIQGPGADVLTISGNNASRVFYIDSRIPATISDLTIANGTVLNDDGGGLLIRGEATLTRLRIINNQSSGSGGSGNGGGLAVRYPFSGQVELIDSEVSGNSASGSGGGIYWINTECETCRIIVRNSTISGNSAGSNGGGIAIDDGFYSRPINTGSGFISNNSTVTNNIADSGNTGSGDGGGFYAQISGVNSATTFANTIVAGNQDLSLQAPDCVDINSLVTSGGFNLIGNANNCNWPTGGTGDIVGSGASPINPLLGPLANNGSSTQTHALLSGSPAIDAGSTGGSCETTDQRGIARPQGAACDIGAFEAAAGTLAATSVQRVAPATISLTTLTTATGNKSDQRVVGASMLYLPLVASQNAASALESKPETNAVTAAAGEPLLINSTVTSPTRGALFSTLAPIAIGGSATSVDSLKSVNVMVDGATVDLITWTQGETSDTTWSTSWTPPGDSFYVLNSVATDWSGRVQTVTVPVVIAVLTAPAVPATSLVDLPFGYIPPTLDSTILTPANGALINTPGAVTVSGGAYGVASLKQVTLRVNGSTVDTISWAQNVVIETAWSASWTPSGAGVYVLESLAEDWAGATESTTTPVTVTVGTGAAPTVALTTASVSQAEEILPGWARLVGTASAEGSAEVEIQTTANGPFHAVTVDGNDWQYDWQISGGDDGVTYPITVRITDGAGQTASDTKNVVVDLVAPAAFTLTLAYRDGGGQFQPLADNDTVHQAGATLAIDWPAATDNSGLGDYLVGWSTDPTANPATLVTGNAGTRHYEATVGDTQILYAHVIAQDSYGNQSVATSGPIYVDGPTTPDLVDDFAYRGWMASGASLISADHERTVRTGDLPAQQFYASWDADTLRLLWQGADWSANGDLFMYLDSAGGGASALYNPYAGATGSIAMPSGFGAEYVIWIQDRTTATLLQSNGGSWNTVQALDADTFRFDIGADPAVTDLRLPFGLLGLNSGSSLKLLAVASEEGALKLWAAAPDKNPLNSDLVTSPLAQGRDLSSYRLTQVATLGALGSGVRPNDGVLPGADLRATISGQLEGAAVSFLGDTLLDVLVPGQPIDANLDGVLDNDLPVNSKAVPLGNGQQVVYTLAYANQGTEVAKDVRVTASARGGLSLANSSFNLGDIAVGVSSTVQIVGTIGGGASAELSVVIADQQHGDFEWQWVQQRILNSAPQNVAISSSGYVRPGITQIAGTVLGLVDVPNIEVNITAVPGGATTLSCVDPSPSDGFWSCPWSPGSLTGINEFQLSARATDRYGNVSGWSPVVTLIADSTPPTIALDAAVIGFLADGYLSSQELVWSGQVVDNREAASVAVCIDGLFSVECDQNALFPVSASAPWQYNLGGFFDEDGVDHTIAIYGIDAVANRSSALTRTVRIDTIAPQITITQPSLVGDAGTLTEILPGQPVAGTVSDGSGSVEMSVLIIAADGTVVVQPIAVSNGAWSYVPTFVGSGDHAFRIQATDRAGNTSLSPALVATASGVTYSLNVSVVGNGTVTPSSGVYAEGAIVSLTATPANGYLFYGWSGDLSGKGNPDSITMNGEKNITATFLTAPQAIVALQGRLQTLVDTGVLKKGQANGLIKPLDNALRSLSEGKINPACSQLQDFINGVIALTPSPLNATNAAMLISEATAIRSLVGCSSAVSVISSVDDQTDSMTQGDQNTTVTDDEVTEDTAHTILLPIVSR